MIPILATQAIDSGRDAGDRIGGMEINSIEHMFVPYQHPTTETVKLPVEAGSAVCVV